MEVKIIIKFSRTITNSAKIERGKILSGG